MSMPVLVRIMGILAYAWNVEFVCGHGAGILQALCQPRNGGESFWCCFVLIFLPLSFLVLVLSYDWHCRGICLAFSEHFLSTSGSDDITRVLGGSAFSSTFSSSALSARKLSPVKEEDYASRF